jgi:hypothetical protein
MAPRTLNLSIKWRHVGSFKRRLYYPLEKCEKLISNGNNNNNKYEVIYN